MINKIEVVRIIEEMKNSTNKGFISKLVCRIEKMSEKEYEKFINLERVKTKLEAEQQIIKLIKTYENTKLDRKSGEYNEIINRDNVYSDILKRAQELKNCNVKEVGYFVYHELCLCFKENTESFFEERKVRVAHYNDLVTEDHRGICKSMAEVYADIMQKLGYDVKLITRDPITSDFPHVDAILFDKDNSKKFFLNLIGDLYRIRSKRISSFFGEIPSDKYRMRIEDIYGKLTAISSEEIREMDEKFEFIKKGEKYINELIDDQINNEKDNKLALFELVQKFISISNEKFKIKEGSGYIEVTQHFKNPIVKMAFKGLISKKDYFDKIFYCDCINNNDLLQMQWLMFVWDDTKQQNQCFSVKSGDNILQNIDLEQIVEKLKNGELRILKPVKSDRTLSLDEYENILERYLDIKSPEKEQILKMYKKQIVINIFKSLENEDVIASNKNINKRMTQIMTLSVERFEEKENEIYELLKVLDNLILDNNGEIRKRISRIDKKEINSKERNSMKEREI